MSRTRRFFVQLLAASLAWAGTLHSAQAGWIAAEDVAAAEAAVAEAPAASAGPRLAALLDRADVAAALQARGVSLEAARERVAALSDAEAAQLMAQIDSAPAGADGVLGTVVFIFVLLLVTDILGFTKVFPFTRSIR
jgi:hypothetical protein